MSFINEDTMDHYGSHYPLRESIDLVNEALRDAADYGSTAVEETIRFYVTKYLPSRPLEALLNDLIGFQAQVVDAKWVNEHVQALAIKREIHARFNAKEA